jgi:hypothetical protein
MAAEFLNIESALRVFATATVHQSAEHIKPTHRHIALRLVLEGGFFPEEVKPHPPIRAVRASTGWSLEYAPEAETTNEMTVFGGMKTKQIDVVVAKQGVGPVLAISVKGTFRAYRNLVNKMEEAIGDSTNLHVMYPGLVYGFLSLIRTNRETDGFAANDMGISGGGAVSPQINRYFAALSEMTGRQFVRNDYTRYESVGLALVENNPGAEGAINPSFPLSSSPLRVEFFFPRLFDVYDLRFPLRAERLTNVRRVAWLSKSPFFEEMEALHGQQLEEILGYAPRLSD